MENEARQLFTKLYARNDDGVIVVETATLGSYNQYGCEVRWLVTHFSHS